MRISKSILNEPDANTVWEKLIENHLPRFGHIGYHDYDEVTRIFVLLADMHAEVMNGGILYYIDNPCGNYFHETLDAAKKIGCTSLVRLLENIACIFPGGSVPSDHRSRRALLDEISCNYLINPSGTYSPGQDWASVWDQWELDYETLQTSLFSLTKRYLALHAEFID